MGDGVVQLSSKAHHDSILSCLQQLRLGGQLIDITVQVDHQGEVEEFQAHQVMLAAYSGYFKRLLLSRDAVPDKLFLSDIRTANFSTFLDFVYTGRAEVARDKLADVRAAAVLLDCKDLSEVCVAAMTASTPSEESLPGVAAAAVGQSDECPSSEAGAKKQPRLRGLKRKPPKGDGVGLKQQQPHKNSADAKKDSSFAAPKERVNDDLEVPEVETADKEVPEVETADKDGGRRVSLRLAGRKISTGVLKRRHLRSRDLAETLDPDSPSSETDENKTAEEECAAPLPPLKSLAVKDEEKEKSSDGDVVVRVVIGGDDDDENEEEDDDDGVESRMQDRSALYFTGDEEEEEAGGDGKTAKKRTSKAQFECGSCQRTFHYARSYIKHISMYHGVKAEVTYQCDTCHQTFANRGNLKIHQRHVHNDERLFPCQVCGKTFKRKKDVIRHQRQVHEGGGQRHICPKCGKSLSSKTALSLHERTHTGAKPFQCTECGGKFSQSSALKMHQRTHTGEKPFACDLCEARFTQKHMLAYHKRSHTGERPFMCEACGKSFASKEYLRHHSNIHTGSRPYKCPQCGRGFAQRNSLHQHLKIHTGERPYSCKDCTKQFTQLNALQRHQRIHTGEKPYMCGLCKRTFTDKSTVRRHTMTHATDGPWKNYLVVLERNMEGTKIKPSAKDEEEQGHPGAEGNQDQIQAKAHGEEEAAMLEGAEAQTETPPSEASSLLVPGQAVTLPADWAAHGTIALVSHSSLGGITVIHAAGTQLQPIVTTDASGTSIISLDGTTIAVPFTLAHGVTHGISTTTTATTDRVSEVLTDALTEVSVSHVVAAASQPSACVLEAAVSQTILAPEVAPPEDEAEATGPPPTVEESGVQDADQFGTEHIDEAAPPSDKLVNTEGTQSGEELTVVIV